MRFDLPAVPLIRVQDKRFMYTPAGTLNVNNAEALLDAAIDGAGPAAQAGLGSSTGPCAAAFRAFLIPDIFPTQKAEKQSPAPS